MVKNIFVIIQIFIVMLFVACSNESVETSQNTKKKIATESTEIEIEIFAKKACGATEPTIALVKDIIDKMEATSKLNIMILKSHNQANELKIIGVPTIRVNGVDIDATADQIKKYGLT